MIYRCTVLDCGQLFTSSAEFKIHKWTHRTRLPKMRIGWKALHDRPAKEHE